MFLTNLKRILKAGFFNFWRNGFVSLSSVFVMAIALGVLGSIIFTNELLDSSLTALEEKVDINVYFLTTAPEIEVLGIKEDVEALPEVAEAVYVSREEALENFLARHQNDATTLQAVEELDENPLGAVLNIRAKETSQYADVAGYLDSDKVLSTTGQALVEKVNYNQNKVAIERLSKIISSARTIGYGLMVVLILLAILITFNTIRMAIYISREEISVMKLVGASPTYIRGPFVVGGVLYGMIAGIITLILFYPITAWFASESTNFFIGTNIFDYYVSNFFQVFIVIVGSGMVMGAVSSFFAVRRYLK
jgi:cell division transport system permease protein